MLNIVNQSILVTSLPVKQHMSYAYGGIETSDNFPKLPHSALLIVFDDIRNYHCLTGQYMVTQMSSARISPLLSADPSSTSST